ncbi:MAG: hypothetical protein ABI611_11400 [Solirubrobacteraceae bacterium]
MSRRGQTAAELTIDELERWALFGAQWRVVDISAAHVVIDLCECTGLPVERRESDDTTLIDYVRSARADLDAGAALSEPPHDARPQLRAAVARETAP